jgi:hypothetical protein
VKASNLDKLKASDGSKVKTIKTWTWERRTKTTKEEIAHGGASQCVPFTKYIWIIRSNRMSRVGHVASMGYVRSAHEIVCRSYNMAAVGVSKTLVNRPISNIKHV